MLAQIKRALLFGALLTIDEIFFLILFVSSADIPSVTFGFMKSSRNVVIINCSHDF